MRHHFLWALVLVAAVDAQCPIGQYGPGGMTPCSNCAVGTFAATAGQSACQACPTGTFAATPAQSACQPCTAGTYANATASALCQNCWAGRFAASPNTVSCTPCVAGKASGPAATLCAACTAGRFAPVESIDCTQCAPGSFQGLPGQASCSACPPNTFAAEPGQTECAPCQEGETAGSGATQCTPSAVVQLACGDSLIDRMDVFGHPPTLRESYWFRCPIGCVTPSREPIWGTAAGWYTLDSNVCLAAQHCPNPVVNGTAFVVTVSIDLLKPAGSRVPSFPPLARNTHQSQAWGQSYPVLFHVEGPLEGQGLLQGLVSSSTDARIPLTPEIMKAIYDANAAKDAATAAVNVAPAPAAAPVAEAPANTMALKQRLRKHAQHDKLTPATH